MRQNHTIPFRLETNGRTIEVFAVDEKRGISGHVMTLYPHVLLTMMGEIARPEESPKSGFCFSAHVEEEGEL